MSQVLKYIIEYKKAFFYNNHRLARSPPFGGLEDQDQIIQKCDLQDQIIEIM